MSRIPRSRRVAEILKTLLESPGQTIPLSAFTGQFKVARSTISEDISLIKTIMAGEQTTGTIKTVPGAGGGAQYVANVKFEPMNERLNQLAHTLSRPERLLPGGFLYITDIIFSPQYSYRIGEIFASLFSGTDADCIVTVETKGIPLALMTAHLMGKPLVCIRRDAEVTEGPSVSINYVSGSDSQLKTMSIPRRAIKPQWRCLVIDDFMRAGGTAQGVANLLAEVDAQVCGTGVLIETRRPQKKMVDNYVSLLKLANVVAADDRIVITPGPHRHARAGNR